MNVALALTIASTVGGFAMMMGGIIASMMDEGGAVQIETTLPAMKTAWRSGDWRTDPYWRRLFVTATGAGLMTVGLFGIFIVIAPWPVKILCAGAILYPAFRLSQALRKS